MIILTSARNDFWRKMTPKSPELDPDHVRLEIPIDDNAIVNDESKNQEQVEEPAHSEEQPPPVENSNFYTANFVKCFILLLVTGSASTLLAKWVEKKFIYNFFIIMLMQIEMRNKYRFENIFQVWNFNSKRCWKSGQHNFGQTLQPSFDTNIFYVWCWIMLPNSLPRLRFHEQDYFWTWRKSKFFN